MALLIPTRPASIYTPCTVQFILIALLRNSLHPSFYPVSCWYKQILQQELQLDQLRISAWSWETVYYSLMCPFSLTSDLVSKTMSLHILWKSRLNLMFTCIGVLCNDWISSRCNQISPQELIWHTANRILDHLMIWVPEYLQESPRKHCYWIL